MRLIDADALKAKLIEERDSIPLTCTERYGFGVEFPNHHGTSMRGGINKAFRCMEQTPTIDAVPVVRCPLCKYHMVYKEKDGNGSYLGCTRTWGLRGALAPDDFCSYGERKEAD